MNSISLFTVLVLWAIMLPSVSSTKLPVSEVYSEGDPRNCAGITDAKLGRFEVLPGGGWDNLRNKEMGMVMNLSYSECRTTEDGMFLIPDGVRAIPVKNSKVDSYAELVEHWDDYTSTLSKSINAEAGLHFDDIGISGRFSDEYEDIKSKQHNDKSVTTRVQARYVQYNAKMEPDTAVSKALRNRLRKIAAHLTLNRTDMARYESQLLVRDFGTHVITSIDVGAALVQVDQLSSQYMEGKDTTKKSILASASANFFGILNFDSQYSKTSEQTDVSGYRQQLSSSKIMSFGGPLFRPMNFTANNWTQSIPADLVGLDRSGEPIYNLINDVILPSVHRSVVYDVYVVVKDAVQLYYEHNSRRGCTDDRSPNFSFQANTDDGTCNKTTKNFTIGGVYQQCHGSGYVNLCKGRDQINLFTNAYSCPQDYQAVLLHTGTSSVYRSRQECHRCWNYFHCCQWVTEHAQANYSAYWCAGSDSSADFKRYLFGGLYTSKTVNTFTQTKSCPLHYYSFQLLADMTVCIGNGEEMGSQKFLPFAGFFSCLTGNPYTDLKRTGAQVYMHLCPEGYSQHLAIIDNECKVYYCVESGAIKEHSLPKIQRPPFMVMPRDGYTDVLDSNFIVNSDGTLWTIKEKAYKDVPAYLAQQGLDYQVTVKTPTFKRYASYQHSRPTTLSNSGIIALSVTVTILCVAVGSGIVMTIRRRWSRNNRPYRDFKRSSTMTHQHSGMKDKPNAVSDQY